MGAKVCCIFNFAPHYRTAIYKLMEEEIDSKFYFGNKIKARIKKIDYKIFSNTVTELKLIWFFDRVYWIKGSVVLIFQPFEKYLLTGETLCLSNWVILIFGKILRKEVYVWSHGWYGKETRIQSHIKKIYLSLATGVFLYGQHAKKLMIANGFKENKLSVIYNSLDYDKMLPIRRHLKYTTVFSNFFKNSYPVLIFIGRVEPAKKLGIAIHALGGMIKKGTKINLVIVGDGSDKIPLQNLVEEFDLDDHVWFYGPTYDEKLIGELIYNSDICISPGNVGLTGIHSLSFGTPVITHNNFSTQMPEFEAVEMGVSGDFFIENDVDSLQNKVENWLSLHPEKSELVVKACYKRIDEFYNPHYQIMVLKSGMDIKKNRNETLTD